MSQSKIHLLDLPNEILLIILKKLDSIDILYSLSGINNERLDNLVQQDIFTNTLNFAQTSSITGNKFDRFCSYILPRTHHCIKKLVLESLSMERILLAGDYPNLTFLELFNFNQEQISHFRDDSIFRHIFQYQITDLILHNHDESISGMRCYTYTKNVYAPILVIFKNIKHFTIVSSSLNEYPSLSIRTLPPTTYFSSTFIVLNINLFEFEDCICLLDGRLKQLTTLIVQVPYIINLRLIPENMDEIHNLKCFSLTSYNVTKKYDTLVVPLLHRMTHLEKLTLYVRVIDRHGFIDGTHLQHEILVHMPQLHTFIFYISTENSISASISCPSNDDIQRTFTNIKYGPIACIMDYFNGDVICHVYSLPFKFSRLEKITKNFPTVGFNNVTHLYAYDMFAMEQEFFVGISKAFPLLKVLTITNDTRCSWSYELDELGSDANSSYSVIEYPHLTSIDIAYVNIICVVQFLLERRSHLPCLTALKVNYDQLQTVTKNFTRDETRYNCSKVKRLGLSQAPTVIPKEFYEYFRLL